MTRKHSDAWSGSLWVLHELPRSCSGLLCSCLLCPRCSLTTGFSDIQDPSPRADPDRGRPPHLRGALHPHGAAATSASDCDDARPRRARPGVPPSEASRARCIDVTKSSRGRASDSECISSSGR